MYLPGHLAMGYLVAAGPALATRRPLHVAHSLYPALLGSVTPDIIDKPLRALELVETGRALGHSIFVLVLLFFLWQWLRDRRPTIARSVGWWIAGIATHHFADLVNDAIRGLEARGHVVTSWPAWPLMDSTTLQLNYTFGPEIRIHPTISSLEIGIYALTIAVAISSRYFGARPGGIDGA